MGDTPKGSTVVWHIQKRLLERGHKIGLDGDLGPRTFWDNSETLRAVLKELGGEIALPKPPAAAPNPTGKRVFIDVGHGAKPGGFDPGAVHAPSRTTEHSLNLIGANALAARLRERGVDARVADASLENYNAGTAARGFDVVISFHHNAAASPAQGSLVVHDPRGNVTTDRALARLVSARVAQELGIPDRGAKEMRLAVLAGARAVGVPTSILVEPYFIHAQSPDRPPAADMPDWSRRAGVAIATQTVSDALLFTISGTTTSNLQWVVGGLNSTYASGVHQHEFAARYPRNVAFIDNLAAAWATGTGRQSAPNGSGNSDWVIGSDSAHCTIEGNRYHARLIAAAAAAKIEALIAAQW